MEVIASKDFAKVVISASKTEEISHMTVFIVVRSDDSVGGITTMPSGMGIMPVVGGT